jgi:hypothetical protein
MVSDNRYTELQVAGVAIECDSNLHFVTLEPVGNESARTNVPSNMEPSWCGHVEDHGFKLIRLGDEQLHATWGTTLQVCAFC